jgi:hypothetical protein
MGNAAVWIAAILLVDGQLKSEGYDGHATRALKRYLIVVRYCPKSNPFLFSLFYLGEFQ